jgi:hypothetical protein
VDTRIGTPSSPSGLLCWARPAGTVPYGPKPASTTDVPWDAVWWWTRPDKMLQVVPSSRFTKQPELIAPYKVTTPLWPAHTIVINPKKPRTEEANGTEAARSPIPPPRGHWRPASQGRTSRRHRGSPSSNCAAQSGCPTTHRGGPRIGNSAGAGGSAGTGASKHADPTTVNAGRNGLPRISKGRKTSR